ncbi:MAG: sulfotransferase domain-containing protein [Holophagae bacterium]|nr:sulfotransferase domain-containing protein [Holophagae bacterium]
MMKQMLYRRISTAIRLPRILSAVRGVFRGKRSQVTCLSVVGCSGHPVLKMVLKEMVAKDYIASVRDEKGMRIKLAGHLQYCDENVRLFEKHNVKAVLVYRDLRDNLIQLVYRSIYNYCSKKFERPGTHPHAVQFHQLIKRFEGERGDQSFVEFYVKTIGAESLLQDIFQVAEWKNHPRVHSVKFEELTNLWGDNRGAQLRTIEGIAGFLGVSLSESEVGEFADRCSQRINKKKQKKDYMVGWEELFSDEDKVMFKEHFGRQLIDLGYENGNDG